MSQQFRVVSVVQAKRSGQHAAVLAVAGYEENVFRLPVDLLECLAVENALGGTELPFSPVEQAVSVIRAFNGIVERITIADQYVMGFIAVVDVQIHGVSRRIHMRAGAAIALALKLKAPMFIAEYILDRLKQSASPSTLRLRRMSPANRLPL